MAEPMKQTDNDSTPERYSDKTARVSALVVDDEPGNLRLTELQLKKLGLDVDTVNDAQQAIDMTLSKQFDMIFMDMRMPVVDGFTAAAQMRENGLNTPIIAITAYAFPEDRQRCINAGCDDYIPKPVDHDLMESIVQKYYPCLGRSR